MIKGCKICGISDPDTLNFLINNPYPPTFIGFICNYPKSSRYVEYENLKKLLINNPKQSYYVAVLVKPNINILEKIKNLPFDYYQLYDCTPEEIKEIKEKYQKKIITAFTIKSKSDLSNYKLYSDEEIAKFIKKQEKKNKKLRKKLDKIKKKEAKKKAKKLKISKLN
jgi:phosphoribosylanthranilate isomerase